MSVVRGHTPTNNNHEKGKCGEEGMRAPRIREQNTKKTTQNEKKRKRKKK